MASASSPPSSDLSDPPSDNYDSHDDHSTAVPSSRPSVDITAEDHHHLAPPSKKRKTAGNSILRASSSQADPPHVEDDNISLSSDGYSSAPGSPSHTEYALREEAQTECLWRNCDFGHPGSMSMASVLHNDDLVRHVQNTHCATGGPKKSKYVCEWGECQRKTSNHPSGYALKAHMRSHTKEKPYYCALPECDKAFTRSDALAKHMRTVHEPEPAKGDHKTSVFDSPGPPSHKKGPKPKQAATNGTPKPDPAPPTMLDEDGNPVEASSQNDNITYIPAHHPITGQPGFMIHYPPDIHFSAWESSIPADQLMRLLRRQLHWAKQEGQQLQKENEELEARRREEWMLKEILLEGNLESEFVRGTREGLFGDDPDDKIRHAMEQDIEASRRMGWTGEETPFFRRTPPPPPTRVHEDQEPRASVEVNGDDEQGGREDVSMASDDDDPNRNATPRHVGAQSAAVSLSPPRTGASGGFEGSGDPYDNYMTSMMQRYEEQRKMRDSTHNLPVKQREAERDAGAQEAAEADAVGALLGMSGTS